MKHRSTKPIKLCAKHLHLDEDKIATLTTTRYNCLGCNRERGKYYYEKIKNTPHLWEKCKQRIKKNKLNNTADLTDGYVRNAIISGTRKLKCSDIPREVIPVFRASLKLKRLLKKKGESNE